MGKINKLSLPSLKDLFSDFESVWSEHYRKSLEPNTPSEELCIGSKNNRTNEKTSEAVNTTGKSSDEGMATSATTVQRETAFSLSQVSENALLEELFRRMSINAVMDTVADKMEPKALSDICKRHLPKDHPGANQSSLDSQPPMSPSKSRIPRSIANPLLGITGARPGGPILP